MRMLAAIFVLSALIPSLTLAQQQLTLIGYNVESGGADQNTLATVIGNIQTQTNCDVWGFCEALQQWAQPFRQAASNASGATFQSVLGTTGNSDRMLVLFNSDRLQQNHLGKLREDHGFFLVGYSRFRHKPQRDFAAMLK